MSSKIIVVIISVDAIRAEFKRVFGNEVAIKANRTNTELSISSTRLGTATIKRTPKSWRLYRGSALQGSTSGNAQHLTDLYIDSSDTNPLKG